MLFYKLYNYKKNNDSFNIFELLFNTNYYLYKFGMIIYAVFVLSTNICTRNWSTISM